MKGDSHLIVTEVPFSLTGQLTLRFGHAHRTPGLHVSSIWTDLYSRLFPENKWCDDNTLSEYGQIGFLWERVLEDALAQMAVDSSTRYFRCGEQVTHTPQGLPCYYTPDCLDLDFRGDGSDVLGLEEWKCTWRSVRNAENLEKNHWKWLVQQKTYCYHLGIRHSRLRAVYLVGDWRQAAYPQTKCWEFEFGAQELEENWSMLMRHLHSNPRLVEGESR